MIRTKDAKKDGLFYLNIGVWRDCGGENAFVQG